MREYVNDPAHPERKEKNRERARNHYRNLSPEAKARRRERTRRNHFLKRYGMTLEERDAMLEDQDFRCACCGDPLTLEKSHVDHSHATDEVRGILCQLCNQGLGMFQDDPNRLRMAINYLGRI